MIERLLMFPMYVIGLFMLLVLCLDPERGNLVTWLQSESPYPRVKLVAGAFLVVMVLGIVGAVLSFLILRPIIFTLVTGLSLWVCLLIGQGLQASNVYLGTYHMGFFMLALVAAGGINNLTERAPKP